MSRSPDRARLVRRGRLLEYLTLGWNVVGVAVLAFAAITAGSVAAAGFGLDSMIEIGASTVVLWQLADTGYAAREHRAMRLIGVGFLLLVINLAMGTRARHRSPSPTCSAADTREEAWRHRGIGRIPGEPVAQPPLLPPGLDPEERTECHEDRQPGHAAGRHHHAGRAEQNAPIDRVPHPPVGAVGAQLGSSVGERRSREPSAQAQRGHNDHGKPGHDKENTENNDRYGQSQVRPYRKGNERDQQRELGDDQHPADATPTRIGRELGPAAGLENVVGHHITISRGTPGGIDDSTPRSLRVRPPER